MTDKEKIYLAIPYSHPNPIVRRARYECANRIAALLIANGHIVFSPISHSHPIAKYLDNANDSKFWVAQDAAFITWCDRLYVVDISGWMISDGVRREVRMAQEIGKRCFYIDSISGEVRGEIP